MDSRRKRVLNNNDTADNLLHNDKIEKQNNESPTHKTAHLKAALPTYNQNLQ